MFGLEVFEIVNIGALITGLMFGCIAQKTQFCFSGSIKDYLLTASTKRAASVIIAMISAIIFTALVSGYFEIDLTSSGYYKDNINYFSIVLGGAMFGIGMMMSDGCSSRHLIKFAQGDTHSLVTLLFIAIFAYATTKGILAPIITPLSKNETLIEISSFIHNTPMNIYFVLGGLIVGLLVLLQGKLKRIFALYDGLLIGMLVAFMWYITGIIGSESMERTISLSSLAFVYPSGKTLETFMNYQGLELQHGVILVVGVFLGAFITSLFNKKYSFGCTSNIKGSKLKYRMIGGALMGTGGVLAIGCTVGQGLSGLSTLAFSSLVAIVSILGSAYITALILNKYEKLPMCFVFEWCDKNK